MDDSRWMARFTNDVSQYGEIDLLIREMVNSAAKHRYIVDVGVLGKRGSNSYDLLKYFGWKGLLIEANEQLVPKIREEFSGLDYELINCAVSDYTGKAIFHLGATEGASSLNQVSAEGWGPTKGAIEVNVRRLGDLLEANEVPLDFDVLSLDLEGEDITVLNDTIQNYSYRPLWIIFEGSFNFRTKSLDDFPRLLSGLKKEYDIVAQTPANLILHRLG